ncbi:bifunctional DNA-formamidopyrimidine glycosylase/DNA-(apurinic or apyrimidinic site) lyase [Rothia aerolata]|uniref:Formamidopyrimidine-DNA glycosylase n=1 Tax=Rothia aerolata TaxID=1812262 RepID=A0A917MRG1_9MICC|nr:bifunctional DNA-formamidopyrimidine glycosylase/DNA-(apurinic or apyrimidinic site) lyase [Rothia aerolata]GGH58793.1 formamidopyrimidine-DNA glycosylase [Rothia aerolata]
MPELPEVEVVRSGIVSHALGRVIESVSVLDERSVRRSDGGSARFEALLPGLKIMDVARRGKYLWLLLGDSAGQLLDEALVVHLGMSGQVLFKTADFPPEKHLKIVLELGAAQESATQLRFIDQRIFGGMYIDTLVETTDSAGASVAAASRSELGAAVLPSSVAHIARDPLDPHFDVAAFRKKMLRTSSGIKRLLLDQSVISGVGNIYADEALWQAKLHYAKPARSVSAAPTRDLILAVQRVMEAALEAGGTSFDYLYVNVNGQSGYFDRSLNAYGQAGKPCKRCLANGISSIMVREPFMGRSSYRCPRCQRKPRGL